RAIDRLGGYLGAAAGDLGERGVLEHAEAGHVREEEVPQAPAPGLPLQVLDDLRVVMGVASLGHLPPVDRLGRVHELLHELGEAAPVVLDLLREREIHPNLPPGETAGQSRWSGASAASGSPGSLTPVSAGSSGRSS